MKKPRWSIFTILIALVIALDIGLLVVMESRYNPNLVMNEPYPARDEQLAEALSRELNEKGIAGFVQDVALEPLRQEYLGPDSNIVALDGEGRVLASANQSFIQDRTNLYLVSSPVGLRSDGFEHQLNTRLALLIDAAGKPTMAFRMVHSDGVPPLGTSNSHYEQLFPCRAGDYSEYIDYMEDCLQNPENASTLAGGYDGADDWYEDSWDEADPQLSVAPAPELPQGAPPMETPLSLTEDAQVRKQIDWELTRLRAAGDLRMAVIPSVWDSGMVVMLYHTSADLYRDAIDAQRRVDRYYQMRSWFLMAVPLVIVLLAMWVAQDARRRNFKPALWGALTLIGNIITWIIYMMVRPDETKAHRPCPHCGAAPKPGYSFCPVCGHALSEKCRSCGHDLEPGFHYCPGCGKPVAQSEMARAE